MSKKFSEKEYILNKYIGEDKNLCSLIMCSMHFIFYLDSVYLVAVESDMTLYLITPTPLYTKPNIVTIQSEEIESIVISNSLLEKIIYSILFSFILNLCFYQLADVFNSILFILLSILFLLLSYFVFPMHLLKLKFYDKSYKLKYYAGMFPNNHYLASLEFEKRIKLFQAKPFIN